MVAFSALTPTPLQNANPPGAAAEAAVAVAAAIDRPPVAVLVRVEDSD